MPKSVFKKFGNPSGKRKLYKKRPARRKNYSNNRALAIQRATFTPQTKMIEFVYDETFLIRGNGLDKDTNTMGLTFDLMDLEGGPGKNAFWGAYNASISAQQSERSLTAPIEGWGRWLSPRQTASDPGATAPYSRAMVVGGKYEVRTELLPRTDNVADADMVRLLAQASYVATAQGGTGNSALTDSMVISDVENFRDVKRNNLVVPNGMGNNGSSSSVSQQTFQKGNWSTKRLFGVSDLKDNQDRFSACYCPTGYTRPEDFARLNIGYYDRIKDGSTNILAHKAMPDIVTRVKINFLVLLSDPNLNFNENV
jgi:hypothetical protein